MARKAIATIALLILLIPAAAPAGPAWTGEPISLDMKNADLEDVFRLFQELSGLEFVIEADLAWRTLTIELENVPWDQAMDMICRVHGLETVRQGGSVLVREPSRAGGGAGVPSQVVLETRIYQGSRNGGSAGGSDVLPLGGPMLVIDSVWVEDWIQQERMLKETFGLDAVNLLLAPTMIVKAGETGTITSGSEEEALVSLTFTAWPSGAETGKVRIRSEFAYKGVPFSETEVVATTGKPFLMGGREDASGTYLFLSVMPRLDGHRSVVLSGRAVRVGAEGVPSPEKVRHVAPAYPRELVKEGVTGMVVLDVYVDESGGVAQILVIKADDPRLAEPAKRAVEQWRFKPILMDGKPIPAWMIVKIDFNLK